VKGLRKLVVYGRSPIDKNTIHIRFANQEGEFNQLIEFTQTDGYEERVFELESITGIQKVTFIFLQGSNFDFGWFQFKK
jgi:beta-galactosidase